MKCVYFDGHSRCLGFIKINTSFQSLNNQSIAYTLALPDLNNQSSISCIPKDTCSAHIRTDGSKSWRTELDDVLNRPTIQVRVGNYTSDINNCVVQNTYRREAMTQLENMRHQFITDWVLNEGNTNPVDIEVEITGIHCLQSIFFGTYLFCAVASGI